MSSEHPLEPDRLEMQEMGRQALELVADDVEEAVGIIRSLL